MKRKKDTYEQKNIGKYKILEEKLVYKDKWFRMFECKVLLPNKEIATWTYGKGSDAVSAVVLDDNKNVFLIREWRLPFKKEIITLPVGGVVGKNIRECLKLELAQEIGVFGEKVEKLATILLGHRIKIRIHIFLVRDLYKCKVERERHEFMKVFKIPFKKAFSMFFEKDIPTTADTLIGLLLTKEKLNL
ncbi:MAG: NUDIX hydrolase [Candidatus Aenigmarchaeota archaeon]|nr:NUDIX hydrolase [Candidatus Aenigmarchaeota archaeon]MDW8149608.1 NUDIX hydrolase [Candidatus Aenigmarchaeota archaeon]